MPKIIVSGRGGSGKSTLVSLMAKQISKKAQVLVVDADESNLGLAAMLGVDAPALSIMEKLGGKPAVGEKLMAMFRSENSERPELFEGEVGFNELPPEYKSMADNLSLVKTGKIEHSMEGCACPMGAVARAFINKLRLDDDQYVIVDTEAGIEHFGRGILEGADYVLMVVDPSNEAVILAEKAAALSKEAGRIFGVVLNKVDEDTEHFLREALLERGLDILGAVPYLPDVTRANLVGDPISQESAEGELGRVLAVLETCGV